MRASFAWLQKVKSGGFRRYFHPRRQGLITSGSRVKERAANCLWGAEATTASTAITPANDPMHKTTQQHNHNTLNSITVTNPDKSSITQDHPKPPPHCSVLLSHHLREQRVGFTTTPSQMPRFPLRWTLCWFLLLFACLCTGVSGAGRASGTYWWQASPVCTCMIRHHFSLWTWCLPQLHGWSLYNKHVKFSE